jgi:hypothetical protein
MNFCKNSRALLSESTPFSSNLFAMSPVTLAESCRVRWGADSMYIQASQILRGTLR